MKNLLLSIICLAGSLTVLSAQDFYLPVSTKSESAKAAYYNACNLYSNVHFKAGKAQIEKALAADPDFFMAQVQLIQYSSGEEKAALIDKALKVDATNFNKAENIMRGLLLEWDKNPDAKTGASMKKLTAAYPDNPQAHQWAYLHAFYGDKDPEAGLMYVRKLQQLSPQFSSVYNTIGYYYMNKGEMGKAKSAFEKYIALSPEESNAYDSMAEYYMKNKDYIASAMFYEKAAELGLDNAKERADKARKQIKQ